MWIGECLEFLGIMKEQLKAIWNSPMCETFQQNCTERFKGRSHYEKKIERQKEGLLRKYSRLDQRFQKFQNFQLKINTAN